MGLEDGDVNFGKCLELALHDGVDSLSGKQVSIHTGDATKFTTYEQLLAAFYGQMDFVDDTLIAISNSAQMAYAEFAPSPWRSCLIAGCLEKGQDYKNGGPLYGDAQFLSFGMPETADSLAAIKKYVFEEKRFTMAEVVDALRKDFEGYEELYNVLSRGPKFGNDDPYVDTIMTQITDHWFAHLKAHRTFRGGVYTGGCSTFTGSPGMGKQTGALPCGHRAGEAAYSDSINAELGQDRHGPTAAIKSALSYDQTEVTSGFVMQLRFEKKLFATEKGQDSFLQLAKSYFQNGGQQLSINVLSAEELRDAQLHPEKYGDLVVRVGGYSDYFTRLNKDLQDNIIARTSH
jgi:formate C-acetyltransferase